MYKRKSTPSVEKNQELINRYTELIDEHKFTIDQLNSIFYIDEIPHEMLGMTLSRNFLLLNKTQNQCYLVDENTILSGSTGNSNIKSCTPIEVIPVKMKNIEYDPSIFTSMLTGTPIDNMFSTKGGIFPATNYMVVGDPGIGKSTLTLDILSNIMRLDPSKKLLFISGEMTRIDMYDYVQRYPKFGNIDTIFLGEYLEENPKQVIETVFNEGYDLILTDSFVEVQESVRESCGMSAKGAEKWLIDQMIINNQGQNKLNKYTAFLMIQQVTKGGNFVGSNKLKHNTTGMMEIRYSNEFNGDRYIKFTKNRRGCEYDKLYFSLDAKEDVQYDMIRLKRDIEIKERLSIEKNQLLKEEELFSKLFTIEEKEIAEQRIKS